MPPDIRRQHFGCRDTRVTPAAAPTSAGPHSPSLLCSGRINKKPTNPSWKTHPPVPILSSPARLARDELHRAATGSGGEGRTRAGSGAQAERFLSATRSPKAQSKPAWTAKGWRDAPSKAAMLPRGGGGGARLSIPCSKTCLVLLGVPREEPNSAREGKGPNGNGWNASNKRSISVKRCSRKIKQHEGNKQHVTILFKFYLHGGVWHFAALVFIALRTISKRRKIYLSKKILYYYFHFILSFYTNVSIYSWKLQNFLIVLETK